MKRKCCLIVVMMSAVAPWIWAVDAVESGPKNGARPGPYTFWVSTGAFRGQETCFICETADRPAVVVFARHPSDMLGKLAGKLDRALAEHKAAQLQSWITFIGKDHQAFDQQLVDWSKQHGLKSLAVGSYKEIDGPPTYRVAREADVTVVVFVNKKVQATFGFREKELTDDALRRVLEVLPGLVEKKPK